LSLHFSEAPQGIDVLLPLFTCTNANQVATCTCNTRPRVSPHHVINHSSQPGATNHRSSDALVLTRHRNFSWRSRRASAPSCIPRRCRPTPTPAIIRPQCAPRPRSTSSLASPAAGVIGIRRPPRRPSQELHCGLPILSRVLCANQGQICEGSNLSKGLLANRFFHP
jgi:hypothetical protein